MTYGRPGVYINETLLPAPIAASGSVNAAGAAIGAFAKGPTTLTLVRSWYDFVQRFGALDAAFPATFGIHQFFTNGGADLYVRRVVGSGAATASVGLPSTELGITLGSAVALDVGSEGNNLRVQVTSATAEHYYNLTVTKEVLTQYLGTSNANSNNDLVLEVFNNIRFDDSVSSDYAQTVVNATSQYIRLSLGTSGDPAVQTTAAVLPFTGGSDGSAPISTDYQAVVATDGSSEFDTIVNPLVIFVPEVIQVLGASDGADVQDSIIAWANSGSGFAVIDTDENLSVDDAITYVSTRTTSSQAAAYYPHYYIQDGTARSRQALRKVAPAGAVAGLYIATDRAAGPFKTPAGVNASIKGAISLERAFTPKDLDSLNGEVNAIRNVPGAGIVVMGGRTLLQDGTANKYVNMRRSQIYIKKQLESITQFAVFQNNDYKLWKQLTNVISIFLNEYRNQGGLRGASPADAYFVTVDASNNTAESIANGVVNISVGVALEYPSEFVVINLSQITGN